MTLDLTSLEKAAGSLDAAVAVASDGSFMSRLTAEQTDTVRAGVIQNFEFTYELCWKFIQRWLKEHQHLEDAALPRTRKDLFRLAAKHGLIDSPERWFDYGDARNITAHTYDHQKAQIVYDAAIKFAKDARALLKRLGALNE
ncbi:MAG: nucleotidyltransferase substrate binding protein [Pseudomonadota bacterium]